MSPSPTCRAARPGPCGSRGLAVFAMSLSWHGADSRDEVEKTRLQCLEWSVVVYYYWSVDLVITRPAFWCGTSVRGGGRPSVVRRGPPWSAGSPGIMMHGAVQPIPYSPSRFPAVAFRPGLVKPRALTHTHTHTAGKLTCIRAASCGRIACPPWRSRTARRAALDSRSRTVHRSA
jgi:hypothetical protein